MLYDEIPPAVRAVLGCWTAYRKLGFSGEDIFVEVAGTPGAPSDALGVFVEVRQGDKSFAALVALWPRDEAEGFAAAWKAAAEAGNDGGISEEDFERIWQDSMPCRQSFEFVMGLISKGFRFPYESETVRDAITRLSAKKPN